MLQGLYQSMSLDIDKTKRRSVLKALGTSAAAGTVATGAMGTAAADSPPSADAVTKVYFWRHDEVTEFTRADCVDALQDAWGKRVNDSFDRYPLDVVEDQGTITYEDLEPYLSDDYGILRATRKWIKDGNVSYDYDAQGVISVFLYDTIDTKLEPYKSGDSVGVANAKGNWDAGGIGMALTFVDRAGNEEATTVHEVGHNVLDPGLNHHKFGNYDDDGDTTTMGAAAQCCSEEVSDVDRHLDYGYPTRHQIRHYLGEQDYDGSDLCLTCIDT